VVPALSAVSQTGQVGLGEGGTEEPNYPQCPWMVGSGTFDRCLELSEVPRYGLCISNCLFCILLHYLFLGPPGARKREQISGHSDHSWGLVVSSSGNLGREVVT
jgi:hypothetical protein